MENTLIKIAKELNKAKVVWAVGGSLLLKQYNIVDIVNDVDIIVSKSTINTCEKVLNELGEKLEISENQKYSTEIFLRYKIDDLILEVMCNFTVELDEPFLYHFDLEDIFNFHLLNGEKIYFTNLVDWFILYQMINREDKVNVLIDYYKRGGFFDFERFSKLKSHIPKKFYDSVCVWINQYLRD